MFDCYNRKINYLRVSVTDRCNLRCRYCMPVDGMPVFTNERILSFEEIFYVVRAAARMGVDKVRFSGGEPLLRPGIVSLLGLISGIPEISDLSLTTNGVLLGRYAKSLAKAGLDRVNVSLDTVDPARFKEITGWGLLEHVFEGIEAAKASGLAPIKLNCVVEKSSDEPDARGVAKYAREKGLEVRFIRRMDLSKGEFWPVEGGEGGDCGRCNRLRLSCDGMVKPCLFSDIAFNVRELGPEEALRSAVRHKPASGKASRTHQFYSIGG